MPASALEAEEVGVDEVLATEVEETSTCFCP